MVTSVEVDEDVAAFAGELERPLGDVVRELLVIELYRQGVISSGRGAELLGMSKLDFIQHTGALGIPYFRTDEEDWKHEQEAIREISRRLRR